jgi:putative ABC transport system ATP-binding protein
MLNNIDALPQRSTISDALAARAAVSLRGVSKSYRRGSTVTPVLNGVDLDVARGEFAFLLGPSGSGKTTLLSIIGCLLSADAGKVRVLNCDPTQLSSAELARLRRDRIGFVFQRFHLIRGLNAVENVATPLTLAGWASKPAERRAKELLDEVGLSSNFRSDPRSMSVGQCQRVAIARALAADPELVLADEPTAALDEESGQQAIELLRRVTVDCGRSAIIVTHDHRILPYADRVIRAERGELHERATKPPGLPSLGALSGDSSEPLTSAAFPANLEPLAV